MSDTLTSFYPFVDDDYTNVCDSDWSDNSEREEGVKGGEIALASTINTALRSSSVAIQGIIEWAAAQANAYDSDTWSTNTLASISLFSSYSDISDLIDAGVKATINFEVSNSISTLSSDLETLSSGLTDGTITVYTTSHLGTSDVGSAGNPIYLTKGSPEECTYINISDSKIRLQSSASSSAGSYSLYCGFSNSLSSSNYQYAIGAYNSLSSAYANNIAIGKSNTCYGAYNTAIGFLNTTAYSSVSTDTNTFALAIGYNNSATQQYTTAVGEANNVSATDSSAFGRYNTVSSSYSTALGRVNTISDVYDFANGSENTIAASYSIAIGYKNLVYTSNSIAIGNTNNSTYSSNNTNTIAIGYNNNASAAGSSYSVAIGSKNTASGNAAIAIGYSNTASGSYSVAIGSNNSVSGNYSVAIGSGFALSSSNQLALGSTNTTIGASNQPIYINAGLVTACSGTVGSSVIPVYMSSGALTATSMYLGTKSCTYTITLTDGSSTSTTGSVTVYRFKCSTLMIMFGKITKSSTIYDDTIYKITLPTDYTLKTFISCTATSVFSQLADSDETLSGENGSQVYSCWGTTSYLYLGADVNNLSISSGTAGISFTACYLTSS